MANLSAPVANLLSRLTGVEEAGSGWKARCPAHEDSTPSLSVREGDDGKVLVHCHAGCKPDAVVAALGLSMADLFPDKTLIARQKGNDEPETVYQYRDLDGKVLFEVCRSRDAQGKKKFFQRRYHEGRIVWSLKAGKYRFDNDSYHAVKAGDRADGAIELPAVEKILYRLPEVQKAIHDGKWIIVCEGEKDADNGAKLGFATTTNPGGAGKWQESYSKALAGARVAIIPDNDDPGRISSDMIAASLSAQGNDVRIVYPETSTKGYDLSDWINDLSKTGLSAEGIAQYIRGKIEEAPTVEYSEVDSSRAGTKKASDFDEATCDKPNPESETANAYRLHDHFCDRLKWVHVIGYFVYEAGRWQESDVLAQKLAMELGRIITSEAADLSRKAAKTKDDHQSKLLREKAERRLKWARQSYQAQNIRNSMKLASSLLLLNAAELDCRPYYLNVKNGTLDLRTRQLCGHASQDYLTKIAPIDFNPSAQAPRWKQFISEIMCGREERIRFLQKALGYSISGLISEQCLFLCHGEGANGKTTMLETIRLVLGNDILVKAAPNLLMAEKYTRAHPTEIADLRGARIVVAQEAPGGKAFDSSKIKALTGERFSKARKMHGDFYEFEVTFKIWITANDLPCVNENTNAFWRRIRLIPFEHTVTEMVQNLDLQLANDEGPGILNWLAEGFQLYQSEGLKPPEEIVDATTAYRIESDTLGRFIAQYCEIGPPFKAQSDPLYAEYKRFAIGEVAESPLSRPAFKAAMQRQGFPQERNSRGNYYTGLRLIEDDHYSD